MRGVRTLSNLHDRHPGGPVAREGTRDGDGVSAVGAQQRVLRFALCEGRGVADLIAHGRVDRPHPQAGVITTSS
jgi:hypothetical protein